MVLESAHKFLSFVNQSPTPFHAVFQAAQRLEAAGFRKVREADRWEHDLKEGKYYFTRNQSSLIAFTIPKGWQPGVGLSIVATHVDSPNLRVRPTSKKSKDGYLQIGVETYGGGIWHSWFDRDLSLAGRVIVTDKEGQGDAFQSKLIRIDRPILRIPTLAIHLERTVNDAFKFNLETEMVPILGMISQNLNQPPQTSKEEGRTQAPFGVWERHHSSLLTLLENEAGLVADEIHDLELHLFDVQPSTLGGAHEEFIYSPRLDNLLSSYCAIEAITKPEASTSSNVNVAALFNHEEIGSVSSTGAASSLLPDLIGRLSPTPSVQAQSIARSFLISADMSHALHPNYTKKHQDEHKPTLNGGIVIKLNANQKYASDPIGAFLVKTLLRKKGRGFQEFEVRNDSPCGSTVGPMLSVLGIRTVDVGIAQLSMHSIRETCGSHDVQAYIDLFDAFYESFAEVNGQLAVD